MRIGVFDSSGSGLGTAIGLAELGHDVAFAGPRGWLAQGAREADRLAGELVRRYFGVAVPPPAPESCDLVVVVDVFADFLTVLQQYGARGTHCEMTARDAGFVQLYPERLQQACEVALRAERVVIVDSSDCQGPREVSFEHLPDATLLQRECRRGTAVPWRPFPFLFNHVMLWLERRPENEWWLPPSLRARQWDWTFCGTIEQPRYGERRRAGLAAVAKRWPNLRGHVATDVPFRDVIGVLQSARFGLDLPGAGELCFRVHECLALGVPLLQPAPFTIAAAPGIEAVVSDRPEMLERLDPEAVRSIYVDCYSPRAAAQALLAAVNAPRAGAARVHSSVP